MKLKVMILTSILLLNIGAVYANEGHKHDEKKESGMSNLEQTLSEVPAQIKSAFPEAKSISIKHKDLSKKQVSDLEKLVGMKAPEPHFHTYIAYGTKNGKKAQLGAATFIEHKNMIFFVIYNNDITIKKIISAKGTDELEKSGFLKTFEGKDHDQSFTVGKDLKYIGTQKYQAQEVSKAVKMNILTMQTLYGKAHHH